jgi:O-antigen/teichoic acid export membrane protein
MSRNSRVTSAPKHASIIDAACNSSVICGGRNSPSGRLLARNATWNLMGVALPWLVAVPTVRLLILNLGASRYGVLTLAFAIVGYFGIFDAGLGQALTKFLADCAGSNRHDEIGRFFWTGSFLLAGLGVVGALALGAISRPLAYQWLNTPADMRAETCAAFRIFACALPFVISLGAFRGALAAHHRFDIINKVRILFGVLSFTVPLLVLPFSRSLVVIIMFLALVRIGNWLLYGYLCVRTLPSLSFSPRWHRASIKPLVSFGAWITASNIFVPFLLYSDRFILGSLVSLGAVSYYAAPLDMVSKLRAVPDALTGALFPAFVSRFNVGDGTEMSLLERSADYLFPALLAPVLAAVVFAREILTLWLGPDFAAHGAIVLQWTATGTLISCMAQTPYSILQAANHPDIAAKLFIFETPIYLLALCELIRAWGVEGAAIAWTIRMSFNATALHIITWHLLPGSGRAVKKNAAMILAAISAIVLASLIPHSHVIQASYYFVSLTITLLTVWFCVLSGTERRSMTSALSIVGGRIREPKVLTS